MAKAKIRIILPAYNERGSLLLLLKRFELAISELSMDSEILIVNDGSTDGTPEAIKKYTGTSSLKIKLLDLQPNRGLAEAVKTGLFAVVSDCDDEDVVIVMDADNTHTPGLIFRMVRLIREGCDVVIASRYQRGARIRGVTNLRKLLSWGASILFRSLVRIEGVKDYTCGYRAYRAGLLKAVLGHYREDFIRQTGFSCMIEILLKLKSFDPIIQEIPLILRYDYKKDSSKMKVWKTVKETLKLLWHYSLGINF